MGKKKGSGDGSANEGGADNKASIKIDMHCDACVREIENCLWNNGVESLRTIREKSTVDITVDKDLDLSKLIRTLGKETKKHPVLLSPAPKKDQKDGAGGDKKKDNPGNKPDQKKSDDEAGVLILKIDPPCVGCFKRSMKLIRKSRGKVKETEADCAKGLITVKGTKKGLESLKEKLPKTVKAAPPPPPKKESAADAGKDNGGQKQVATNPGRHEVSYLPGFHPEYGYPHGFLPVPGYPPAYAPGYPYGYGVYRPPPAPQIFSDENPNACSIM